MRIIYKIKIIFILLLTTVSFTTYSQSNIFRVTLDAGHGAHDFGAVYEGRVEKNIALAVVLKVGKILEATPKISVTYTRKTDVFIDLIERANIANRSDANIFVSIHCNANRNTAADGTETYVMGMNKVASNLEAAKKENSVITLEKDYKQKYEGFDPNSPETMIGMTLMQEEYLDNSISLASKIEEEFADLGKKIRGGGVKQAPFMVLHKAYMPRVLIEMGFISNSIEGNTLNSEEGQNEIAKAIADAIVSYKSDYYGNGETEIFDEKPSQKIIDKPIKDTSSPVKPKVNLNSSEVKKTIKNADNSSALFKVQLSASVRKVELAPKNFKGLKNISVAYDNRVYKYMYGETPDYDEAKKQLQEAKEKGYDSAFLIAFKNGEKISIQEALK
ncbi:N-acetylmuramoyl-L-alanine amidase [Flavobacterium gawalongense]|uniref:N-acetylmuramoyl-L-alanine amidase family protein n=1 Tax=Flavobacterium gawalongense TaxID=2594432 RepID=UPI00118381E1|nr:N-acetylmuramoyl-L-alanine amidase [Flavobacterium gawalongense]TRX10214.1 N-acetylmuramoyl-L-alanine amidase [Flavobacterium gawalongense]TRX27118.1 N-acetylmuramoyl-L-alanine amidase [Flavobacterium gawalongense]